MHENIPEVYVNLGFIYHYGLGTYVDDQLANDFFIKAAKHRIPQAEYHLGIIYRDGRGVAKNLAKADQWFQRARQQGVWEADEVLKTLAFKEPDDVYAYQVAD